MKTGLVTSLVLAARVFLLGRGGTSERKPHRLNYPPAEIGFYYHCQPPHAIRSKLCPKTSFILSGAERGLQARSNLWIVTWPEIKQALPTFGNLVPEGTDIGVAAAAWRKKKRHAWITDYNVLQAGRSK